MKIGDKRNSLSHDASQCFLVLNRNHQTTIIPKGCVGKTKKKEGTIKIAIRLPESLMLRVRQQAEDENRSPTNLIITYLQSAVQFSTLEHREKLEGKRNRRGRR